MGNIAISLASESKVGNYDLENIVFGRIFTDHMFTADYDGEKWDNFQIAPVSNFSIHPGNMAWHYGQAIFEGMKASMHQNGTPMLMQPKLHAQRLNTSAVRMCMPEFPEDIFVEALHNLVHIDQNWIPKKEGSALYLRPFMIATDECIGVRESSSYKFIIVCLPAGPYYAKPVRLKVEDHYVRAAVGGVGEAKAAGNYAASLYPAKLAKKEGFDQIMWLDAKEYKYIQEVGTMNIFFVIDGKVVTPSTDGAILKGITRKMVMKILTSNGFEVEQRPLTIDQVVDAYKAGKLTEVFGTGTAAVVAMVSYIQYKDTKISLNIDDMKAGPLAKSYIDKLRTGAIEDEFGWTVAVQPSLATV